jgi:hypothetical protein
MWVITWILAFIWNGGNNKYVFLWGSMQQNYAGVLLFVEHFLQEGILNFPLLFFFINTGRYASIHK